MPLCIPIRADNLTETLQQIKKAEKAEKKIGGKDNFLLEIWLDRIPFDQIKIALKSTRLPVIAVCRGVQEKGSFRASEEARIAHLAEAIRIGAVYVDMGIQTAPHQIRELKILAKKTGAKIIVSQHFWHKTPALPELIQTAKKARQLGADIVKIATFIENYSDNVTLFELTRRLSQAKIPAIVVGMGEKGYFSRLGTPVLGAFLTYIALDSSSRTAPGQPLLTDWQLEAFMLK